MTNRISDQSIFLLNKLLESARAAPQQKAADDHLSQCEGMIAIAAIEHLITRDEQVAYWETINQIKDDRAKARTRLEEART